MYFLGVISSIILPFALLFDFFFPIFGRGPHGRKKEEGKEAAENSKAGDKSPLPSKKSKEQTIK